MSATPPPLRHRQRRQHRLRHLHCRFVPSRRDLSIWDQQYKKISFGSNVDAGLGRVSYLGRLQLNNF